MAELNAISLLNKCQTMWNRKRNGKWM